MQAAEVPSRVTLPRAEPGPLGGLARRLALAIGLIAFVTLVAYADRGGYRDADGTAVSFLDAAYYSTVSITTTGYGDIAPVTDRARLLTTLLVTPARILFLVLLVGTTLELLAERTRTAYRLRQWRRSLRDHVIICGFGTKGRERCDLHHVDGNAAGVGRRHRCRSGCSRRGSATRLRRGERQR